MAFPGTFNIDYYRGDTYEFKIYPKDSTGAPFSLFGYTSPKFTIATSRGEFLPDNITSCYASIEDDHILCAIRPTDGERLSTEKSPYYYDVEIINYSGEYQKLYTILTGTVSVTEQVTPRIPTPNAPTGVQVTNVGASSFTVTWNAPVTGEPYTGFTVGYTNKPVIDEDAITENVGSSTLTYTFTDVPPGIYGAGVFAFNNDGPSPVAASATPVIITGSGA